MQNRQIDLVGKSSNWCRCMGGSSAADAKRDQVQGLPKLGIDDREGCSGVDHPENSPRWWGSLAGCLERRSTGLRCEDKQFNDGMSVCIEWPIEDRHRKEYP